MEYGNAGSLIDGNTFTDNQNTGEYVVVYISSTTTIRPKANPYYCYTDTYTYVDKPEAVDIYLNVQSSSTISNNVFENDFRIQSYGSELDLSGNQWSEYRGTY